MSILKTTRTKKLHFNKILTNKMKLFFNSPETDENNFLYSIPLQSIKIPCKENYDICSIKEFREIMKEMDINFQVSRQYKYILFKKLTKVSDSSSRNLWEKNVDKLYCPTHTSISSSWRHELCLSWGKFKKWKS